MSRDLRRFCAIPMFEPHLAAAAGAPTTPAQRDDVARGNSRRFCLPGPYLLEEWFEHHGHNLPIANPAVMESLFSSAGGIEGDGIPPFDLLGDERVRSTILCTDPDVLRDFMAVRAHVDGRWRFTHGYAFAWGAIAEHEGGAQIPPAFEVFPRGMLHAYQVVGLTLRDLQSVAIAWAAGLELPAGCAFQPGPHGAFEISHRDRAQRADLRAWIADALLTRELPRFLALATDRAHSAGVADPVIGEEFAQALRHEEDAMAAIAHGERTH